MRGNRNCVADVSEISAYPHEQEVLISANAGFKILSVDMNNKALRLQLVDEAHCLKTKPKKFCDHHRPIA